MTLEKEKRLTVLQNDEPYCLTASYSIFSNNDCSTKDGICQGFTENCEIEEKFTPKRKQSELLAASFKRLDMDKRSARVSDCGTYLTFAHQIDGSGNVSEKGKLHNANFCRDRLCPMCAWRRSYKIFAQVSKIMAHIKDDYAFLFLTLTIPNISSENVSEALQELQQGWQRLRRTKRFKSVIKGYFKALEITYNKDSETYHPHFHIVLAVSKSYFNSRANDYISRSEWLQMWRDAMNDQTITQVDIRRAKSKYSSDELNASSDLSSAVAEVAKYAVKLDDDLLVNDEVIGVLASVLHGKRLCEFDGKGAFGLARLALKLDDAEDGDLIHIDDDEINPALAFLIVRYGWSAGAYKMIDSVVKTDL